VGAGSIRSLSCLEPPIPILAERGGMDRPAPAGKKDDRGAISFGQERFPLFMPRCMRDAPLFRLTSAREEGYISTDER